MWASAGSGPFLGIVLAAPLTHSDSDHSGGLGAVLRYFRVGEFWESGRWELGGEPTRHALEQSGTARRVLTAGQRLWVGSALFTALNPGGDPNPSANDDSLVLRVDWRGLSVVLTGDLGEPGERRILERGGPLR